MEITTLRPDLEDAYDRYLLTHPESLLYHSTRYKDFLKAHLGCAEEYLLAVEEGRIRGVLPMMYLDGEHGRVYNSLPFYGSNGGILADSEAVAGRLVQEYNSIATRADTLAATLVTNPFAPLPTDGFVHNFRDARIGQFTSLELGEDPWNGFMERIESSGRRNIRKAVSAGVEVTVENDAMDFLREVHQANIRAIGGKPKGDDFFALVSEHFRRGEDFEVFVAAVEGTPVAALLLFYFNRTVEYFTPATVEEHRGLQPMALILIHVARRAAERGYRWLNWGGTWKSQTGVFRFKQKWAADEKEYAYFTQLNDPAVLRLSPAEILGAYPDFFVVPFHALAGEERSNG